MVLLFSEGHMHYYLLSKKNCLENHVSFLTKEEILVQDFEELTESIVQEFKIQPLEVDPSKIYLEDPKDVVARRPTLDPFKTMPVKETRIEMRVPFGGDSDLLGIRPSTCKQYSRVVNVEGKEIVLFYQYVSPEEMEEIKREIEKDKEFILETVDHQEKNISDYNDKLPELIRSLLEKRKEKIEKDNSFIQTLSIPVKRKEDVVKFVPQKKKKISPKKISVEAIEKEYELEYSEYEYIIDVVNEMGMFLERASEAIRSLEEEELRDLFLAILNSHYENGASGETFNRNGRTDILLKTNGKCAFIAECKVWRGEKSIQEGISQLLNYLSWRDTKTSLIVFNKDNKCFTDLVSKAMGVVESHENYVSSLQKIDESCLKCKFRHKTDTKRELYLTLHLFNIQGGQEDGKKTRSIS